jgi:hypothetical protein
LIADARSSENGIPSQEVKPWESTLRLIDAEYQLWSNRGAAIATAIQGNYLENMPIARWMKHYLRRIRRAISRNEWAVRLLKLPRSEDTEVEPGRVLIQIDGLSRNQFESALAKGRLRFLSWLINQEGCHTHSMYSGLPSSTPAVQGERFYGVRGAVPAFSLRDHPTGEPVRMYDPGPAADVQSRLASAGSGLLQGGSSYSHWSLKEIDHAIRRIWDAAHHSPRRDYLVWVYSNHGHRPSATLSSSFPLGRVDHVFVSDHFDVVAVEIARSRLARVASDHLPLLVELRLRMQATVTDVLSTEAEISGKVYS